MLWYFPVKDDRVDEFENLCKEYGYEPTNYYGDGYYDVLIPTENQAHDFYEICLDNDLLWEEED